MKEKRLISKGLLVCFVLFLCAIAGCGGGSSQPPSPPTPPPVTITSITVSCASTTPSAGTSNCSANVQGTGNFNPVVTWSASAGTISSAGVLTAPSVASPVVVMVTAVSVQDAT